MSIEKWKVIPSYPAYAASNLGRIKRIRQPKTPASHVGRILSLATDRYGYEYAMLYGDEGGRTVKAHRAIAEAWLGPCPDECVVNHKDGVRTNNRVANLEYITAIENCLHAAHVLGRKSMKLRPSDVTEIRALYWTDTKTRKELEEMYKVSNLTIRRVLSRVTWDHVDDGFPAAKFQ